MACAKIFEDMKARGITKIGMISGTDGFGASMRKQCLEIVGDYGIEVLADESYGPTDADMTPQLTNIKSTAGVQAVLNAGFGQGPAIVTRNYGSSASSLPLYQSHGVASKGFIELAGAAPPRACGCPARRCSSPTCSPSDDPQKPVVTAYKPSLRGGERRRRPRPSAAMPTTPSRCWSTRSPAPAPAEPRGDPRRDRGDQGLRRRHRQRDTCRPDDHLGLDLSAFRMLEIKDGDWALVD